MLGYQESNRSSLAHISRKKSQRKFGSDLTNILCEQKTTSIYNNGLSNGPNNTKKKMSKNRSIKQQKSSTLFMDQQNTNSKYTKKTQSRSSSRNTKIQGLKGSFDIMGSVKSKQFNRNIRRQPLDDHIQDILFYSIEQSYYSAVQQNYLQWQTQITRQMREILVSWLVKVHNQFRLRQKTLYLAINLLDRYCYLRNIISKQKYQLLGITCLFMASKYQQITLPKIHRFLQTCVGLYNVRDMINMESQILIAINFQIEKVIVKTRDIMLARIQCQYTDLYANNDYQRNQRSNMENLGSYMSVMSNNYGSQMDIQKDGCYNMNMRITTKQSSALTTTTNNDKYQQQKKLLKNICEYILELTLLQHDLNKMKSNYMAAVIMYIGIKIKNQSGGSEAVEEYQNFDNYNTHNINNTNNTNNGNNRQVLNLGSKKIIEKYQLNQKMFKEYFHQLLGLYKRRGQSKFIELNKKYKLSFGENVFCQ